MMGTIKTIMSALRGQDGKSLQGKASATELTFGPLSVRLSSAANDPIAKLLLEDFSLATNSSQDPDIHIRINGDPISPDKTAAQYIAGNNTFYTGSFTVKEPRFSYSVENAFGSGAMTIDLHYEPSELKAKPGASEFDQEQLNRRLKDAIASYNCLWYLFALALMKREFCFLHAGVVENAGVARAFAGVGGSGKTSLTTRHLEFPGTFFLAEDFGVFGADGRAYFSPKTASIYASDVKYGQSDLVRYVERTMTPEDRADWIKLEKSGKNPRRKVSPHLLFAEKCKGQPAAIKYAFFMNRQSAPSVTVENLSLEEFCRRSLAASMRELKRLTELLQQAAAVTEKGLYPSPLEIEEKLFNIYQRAFSGAETYLVRAPIGCTPDDVVAKLPGGTV